jgi:hypothetical protein
MMAGEVSRHIGRMSHDRRRAEGTANVDIRQVFPRKSHPTPFPTGHTIRRRNRIHMRRIAHLLWIDMNSNAPRRPRSGPAG